MSIQATPQKAPRSGNFTSRNTASADPQSLAVSDVICHPSAFPHLGQALAGLLILHQADGGGQGEQRLGGFQPEAGQLLDLLEAEGHGVHVQGHGQGCALFAAVVLEIGDQRGEKGGVLLTVDMQIYNVFLLKSAYTLPWTMLVLVNIFCFAWYGFHGWKKIARRSVSLPASGS